MFLKISSIRCLDVKIIKDGEVLYEGNVDNAPQELKDLDYKTISGAYPTIIEV